MAEDRVHDRGPRRRSRVRRDSGDRLDGVGGGEAGDHRQQRRRGGGVVEGLAQAAGVLLPQSGQDPSKGVEDRFVPASGRWLQRQQGAAQRRAVELPEQLGDTLGRAGAVFRSTGPVDDVFHDDGVRNQVERELGDGAVPVVRQRLSQRDPFGSRDKIAALDPVAGAVADVAQGRRVVAGAAVGRGQDLERQLCGMARRRGRVRILDQSRHGSDRVATQLLPLAQVSFGDEPFFFLRAQQALERRRDLHHLGGGARLGIGVGAGRSEIGRHLPEQRQRGGGGLPVSAIDRGKRAQDDPFRQPIRQREHHVLRRRLPVERFRQEPAAEVRTQGAEKRRCGVERIRTGRPVSLGSGAALAFGDCRQIRCARVPGTGGGKLPNPHAHHRLPLRRRADRGQRLLERGRQLTRVGPVRPIAGGGEEVSPDGRVGVAFGRLIDNAFGQLQACQAQRDRRHAPLAGRGELLNDHRTGKVSDADYRELAFKCCARVMGADRVFPLEEESVLGRVQQLLELTDSDAGRLLVLATR